MSEEEKEAKAQKKVEKEKNTQATQDALETGARAAATFFGGPGAGKLADIGLHLPHVRLLFKGAAKVANRVPGVATTTRRAQSSGALKAVDAVAGGSPKFKAGPGVKGTAGSVLGGKSANNLRNSSGGQQSPNSLNVGLDQNNSNQDNTTKTFRNKKNNRKKALIIIIAVASLLFAGSVLISVIAEVASPIVKIKEFIEDIFDSDEDELTDDEKELIEDSYKEYLCGDKDDDDCIARYESFIDSQEDFMERFKTVSKEYNLTKRQQVILYQTIIFGYPMEEIMPGEVYNIDKSTDDENVYEKENDTIETLAKLFDGSEETYYNNLIEEDFFDDRKPCHNYYKEYADSNGLNPDNIDSWEPSDKQEVRKKIVKEIKSMSSEYLDSGKKQTTSELHVVSNNAYYWWPIGGEDKPLYTGISSSYGYRTHPITGEKQSFHNGIDIPAVINTPVIASQSGTVIAINNNCNTSNSKGCGSGYGNYIKIKTKYNYTNIYAHLAKNSLIVQVGSEIEQGQKIAGVGSSGNSTGPHLHFSFIDEAGSFVNPLDFVDPKNPRPVSYTNLDDTELSEKWNKLFKFISYNEGGFSNSNKVVCALDGIPTSRYGMVLKYRVDDFARHGYKLTSSKGDYSEYCGKELPNEVTKAVFIDLLDYWEGYIKAKAVRNEITLNKNQLDALIDLAWSGYDAIDKFFVVYKSYGNGDSLCTKWWNNWYVESSAAKAQGKDATEGLKNRRKRECNLFVHGDYGPALSQ